VIRRNLTPPVGIPVPGLPPTRRTGGARQNVSYRVALVRGVRGDLELTAWALNLSRGGLRAILEDRIDLGEEVLVRIDEIQIQRRGRVVWTQDEPDGTIVGIAFYERMEAAPPGVELDSSIEIALGDLAAKLGMTEAQLQAALDDTDPVGKGLPDAGPK
jgi:hypothetical protein